MKKLFYGLSSSRSFAGLFSMHARLEERRRVTMIYKKLISVLVFAVFTFYFSGAARAQGCDNPDFCFDFGIPSFVDNFTGSSVRCTLLPGGTDNPINKLDIGTLGEPTAIFKQDGLADCTYIPNPPQSQVDLGTCQFHLEMSGVTTTTCNTATNSFIASALCQDKTLQVTGSITGCSKVSDPTKVLNLAIGGAMSTNGSTARNKNNCENVFPADPTVTGLPAGKVLDLTIRTQGSAAGFCTGPFVAISDVKERWCNSGVDSSGNFIDGPVNCVLSTGVILTSQGANASAVPFDFNVRQTVNTSPCSGGGNQDAGKANIDILGGKNFITANIDKNSLFCGGSLDPADLVQLKNCTESNVTDDGFPDLSCQVATCPNFGPGLANPNADFVTAFCTGRLNPAPGSKPGTLGTQILGIDESVRIN
jgi:hypothetical protein